MEVNWALGGGVWLSMCLVIRTHVHMATLPVRIANNPSLPPAYLVAKLFQFTFHYITVISESGLIDNVIKHRDNFTFTSVLAD